MRVLILSQYFEPEPIPKPYELAKALQQRGHDVSVLTGLPNYPDGRLYEGYSLGFLRREVLDGVRVVRSFEYPYHGSSVIGRFANYGSFMVSASLASAWMGRHDVVYVWHPPLTVGVAAWFSSRMVKAPFVYDVQDIWPESAVLSGMLRDGMLVRFMSVLERFVYGKAAHVITVTDGARRNLIGKGVAPDRVSALPHWIDESIFIDADPRASSGVREQFDWQERFVVMFAGNLGLLQGLETIVAAADRLRDDGRILFVLVGGGAGRGAAEAAVAARRLEGVVEFVDHQPMEEMPAFLGAADALLVHLRRSEFANFVIPTKTLAYLAAARPILMALEGAAADLVSAAGAGITIAPEDPNVLAAAVRRLADMPTDERNAMGANGRRYLQRNLAKGMVLERYCVLLEDIAGAGGPP